VKDGKAIPIASCCSCRCVCSCLDAARQCGRCCCCGGDCGGCGWVCVALRVSCDFVFICSTTCY
jgi:hypothetical protein